MRLLSVCFALCFALPVAAQETIAYWAQNANNLPGGGFGFTPDSFPQPADDGTLAGQAWLALGNFDESVDGDGVYECIPSFAGTVLHALPGYPAGGSLSPEGCADTSNNGMYIELVFSTEGYESLVLSWAQRGTSTGFTSRQLSWSADGGDTFTDFGSDTGALGSDYVLRSYDLSAIEALNDHSEVRFRITLEGASGASGNNRFDNIRLDGMPLGGEPPGPESIPYEHEFSANPYSAGWSVENISGLDNWAWNASFGNVTFSAFDNGTCQENTESWLISPGFDLDAQQDERLFVDVQRGFSGDDNLRLYFSDDYSGEGDPGLATWTLLQEVTPGDFSTNNTPVTFGPFFEIQTGEGIGYFAAHGHFTSGACSTWRISRLQIDIDEGPPEGFACHADPEDDEYVTRIHDIQGDGFTSPLAGPTSGTAGESVQVQAIVVGVFQNTAGGEIGGFFVQEPDDRTDANPLTSEGIYISPAAAGISIPAVSLGDEIRIQGSVREEFGQTEIFQVGAFELCGQDQLAQVTPAEIELPVADWLDLEAVEGMWIRLPQALAVTEVFNAARFAEFAVAPERLFTPTQVVAPGQDAIELQELNDLSRLIIDEGKTGSYVVPYQPGLDGSPLNAANPIRVGYRMQADFDGILGFGFSNYRVFSLQPVIFDDSENPRSTAPELPAGNLRAASINLENLFATIQTGGVLCGPNNLECRGATSATELERQLDKLVAAILEAGVDIAGLVEVENDDDDATLQLLTSELNALDPVADWDYIATGWSGTDAIKNAIIYRSGKVTPLGDYALLDSSVEVTPPFDDSRQRPVLSQTFEHVDNGEAFTLSVFHLRSKTCGTNASGDNLDQGDGQGCWNRLRTDSVESFLNWLATDPTGAGTDRHMVMGDFNAYAQEDPLQLLTDLGYVNQAIDAHGGDPAVYSYVFQGQSGSLDHTFVSPTLQAAVLGAAHWPINADEIPAFGYSETLPNSSLSKPADFYQPDPYRSSDHDPLIISLFLAPMVTEDMIFSDRFE